MKLGSLFDGSGGFPLASFLCDIEPVWASEVEPYPIAVTKTRFPTLKHLGDISKINGAEIEPVDIITFGSPCQDLSVAGKRAGLKHEDNGDDETTRSGLFIEAVRIIKEMREKTNGEYPRFAVWENVTGAFSSNKGEDFKIVLEEIVKVVEPTAVMPEVPRFGWAYADSYCGDGWSLAYRVFDAQYWGVPQRRRRIYLVADFRGQCARKILFEREGLHGCFAEGGTPWQTTPADAERGIGADDSEGESFVVGTDLYNHNLTGDKAVTLSANSCMTATRNGPAVLQEIPYTLKIRSGCEGGGKGALVQENMSATLACNNDQYLFQPVGANPCYEIDRSIAYGVVTKGNGDAFIAEERHTALSCGGGQAGQGYPCAMQPVAEATEQTGLSENNQQWICKTWDARGNGDGTTANTITGDHENRITDYTSVVVSNETVAYQEVIGALYAGDSKVGSQYVGQNKLIVEPYEVHNRYIVRRLMPIECSRLQGFADHWGDIDKKSDFSDEEYRFWHDVRNTHASINGRTVKEYNKKQMLTWYNKLQTDSAEYKMWGNGIALPTALYVMQGIKEASNENYGYGAAQAFEPTSIDDPVIFFDETAQSVDARLQV